MTPYQVSSEIYGGFFYPGITLIKETTADVISLLHNVEKRYFAMFGVLMKASNERLKAHYT